jgi:predicted phage baseplate assembly protein
VNDFRLVLDNIDFAELVEFGRSMIPTYAPEWTDHNYHDPGIMLIELLAFVADAQIYALSRTRRDERQAYARLVGVEPRGPQPATGLIWPSKTVAATPLWPEGTVVPTDQAIIPDYPDAPNFFATRSILLTTAQLTQVFSRFANSKPIDWTRVNSEDGATFRPFGTSPAPGDRLVLQLSGSLTPQNGAPAAPIAIGIEVADPTSVASANSDYLPSQTPPIRLAVAIEEGGDASPVELVADTTNGLSRSGVLLLQLAAGSLPASSPFLITIGSTTGNFLRPPHLQRIGLNVLPVIQQQAISEDPDDWGRNLPDQTYTLASTGLIFPPSPAVSVQLSEQGTWQPWSEISDLESCGPNDRCFVLDPVTQTLTFGNAVNGAMPPAGATLLVEYQASAGAAGNLPSGVSWSVTGIAGVFGSNSAPTSGGVDARSLSELQALARQRSLTDHPLVAASDLTSAADAFADLGVTRAAELAQDALPCGVQGRRVLIAVGQHDPDSDETEPAAWLAEIRRRLVPRLPLGQSLEVIAPQYVKVGISAELIAARNTDPAAVQQAAIARLEAALAVVADEPGQPVWPFGREITVLTVKGWLRNVDGVARVVSVALRQDGTNTAGAPVHLAAAGLPLLTLAAGDISVTRWSAAGAPQ